MSQLIGAIRDSVAAASAQAGNLVNGPIMVVDFHTYKPPEELRVKLEDVYENWKKDLLSGSSFFTKREEQSSSSDKVASKAEVGNGGSSAAPPAPATPAASVAPAAPAAPEAPAAPVTPAAPDFTPATSPPRPAAEPLSQAAAAEPFSQSTSVAEEIANVVKDSAHNPAWPNGIELDVDPVAKDILLFQLKVFKKAGLSETGTFLPKSIHPKYCGSQPQTDLDSAMVECKMAVCGAVEGLLDKMNMSAKDVDILITTCSIFCPTPSMSSMLVNHFKMRNDVQSYHLGGMGCANGVIAINLIRDLLKAHPNSNALLVCNETTTPALYKGKDKHRLVTNVLFRMGASAILLSNNLKWRLQGRAKYALQNAVRVHIGARDDAYTAIHYGADDEGINGIYLGLNVVKEATKALTIAMLRSGRYILTTKQLFQAAWHYWRKHLGSPPSGPFSPSFAEGVQHFLIHAGGAKVLDGIGSSLKLTEGHLEPSRAVLWDYGNVSSSTTWYTLAFIETVRGLRRGDKVLQIGVGSGIKCGVNVWKALRDIDDVHPSWEHRVNEERRAQLLRRRRSGAMAASLLLLLLTILVVVAAVLYQHRLPSV